MKIYSLTGFPSALTGSFTGSFFGDGSGLTGTDSGSWDGIFSGSAEITGSLDIIGGSLTVDSDAGTIATFNRATGAGKLVFENASTAIAEIGDSDAVGGGTDLGFDIRSAAGRGFNVYTNSDLDSAASTPQLTITSGGNVGIGETSPEEALEIKKSSLPAIQLNQNDQYKSIIRLAGNDLEIRGSSGAMEFYNGSADGDSSALVMSISSGGAATFNSSVSDQVILTGGASLNTRLKINRGTDDTNQNLLLGYNKIIVTRLDAPLASPQTDFTIQQQGSDGTRTPFTISSGGDATFSGQVSVFPKQIIGSYNSGTAGTAALPSYAFYANEDMGMYPVGTDTLGFSTAGQNRLTILSDGFITQDISRSGFAMKIVNTADASQGLQILSADNDTGLYILDCQSSVGGTYSSKFLVEKSGAATFTGLINANQGVEVVDTTAGSAGTPNFKTILDYKSFTNRATIKGGNEASGTQGTYLKFYVNNLTTANSPLNLLTLQSSFVNGTNAQFDALIKANNGISFPNQSAGSGTVSASTLDAYEEGTWTPTNQGTSNITVGPTAFAGTYTRIGNRVFVEFKISGITAPYTGALIYITLGGFPYVQASNSIVSNGIVTNYPNSRQAGGIQNNSSGDANNWFVYWENTVSNQSNNNIYGSLTYFTS